MINAARMFGRLVCVAREDLGAPYCERGRERHKQLCAALREHADIELQLEDFFGRDCANPLSLAEVGERRDLLVVDCAYALKMEGRIDSTLASDVGAAESFEARARRLGEAGLRMSIAPDSIKFYIFEQIEARTSVPDSKRLGAAP